MLLHMVPSVVRKMFEPLIRRLRSGSVFRCRVDLPLMSRSRTTAIACLALLAAFVFVAQARAKSSVPKRIIFPVVGDVRYADDFGAPRPQGSHQGNDIMAAWRSPVVAVEAGTVKLWTASARAGCMLWLNGKSGTKYAYIHLNNDLTPTSSDDGGCAQGVAYAPGLVDGQKVAAGQLIAFVGDSGDAENGVNHLHFEIADARRGTISPYRSLRRAKRLLFAVPEFFAPEGLGFRLRGTVLWVKHVDVGARLAFQTHDLRGSDGSRYAVTKRVVVTVPADAKIKRKGKAPRQAVGLAGASAGERVTVFTRPALPTMPTALGKRGVLIARKVVLRPPR